MKKSGFFMLVLAVIAVGGVFAQEAEKDEGLWATILSKQGFAPGIEGVRFFINGGVGFEIPFIGNVNHNMPPLSASVDYVFPGTAMSLGGKIAFSTLKWLGTAIDDCVNIDIALRLAVHSNILESIHNLDVAALVLVGFDFATGDTYELLKERWKTAAISSGFDGFYIGIGLGGRYFFTQNIGAFLEADVKFIQKMSVGASAGLALKF